MFSGVSRKLALEKKVVCGMHVRDKLGQSAVGALEMTKGKQVIKSLSDDQVLLKKARALAVHLRNGNRQKDLLHCWTIVQNQPSIKLLVAFDVTRGAAQHSLLYSEGHMNRCLKMCIASKPRLIESPPTLKYIE